MLRAEPYIWRDPSEIGRRPRLYGKHYVRGFVSTTIGRPGLGKSALSIVEMLSMATGRPLLGHATEKPLGVWYIGEDPLDEIERRIVAACEHHRIGKADIDGRLYINSALEMPPLKLAEQQRGGSIINREALAQLAAEIESRHIDALILDPLIKFHGMPEGDNSGMELVMRALAELAGKTNIAIETPHHIRKQPPGVTGPATVDDGRGASAIIGAVRSARVLNPMSAADADKAGIAEGDRWRYIRLDQAKANMAPPEAAAWLQHASEILPCGESVGVVAAWKFPDAFANVTGADVSQIRALARTGAFRSDERAKDWFGKAVADHLHLDLQTKSDRAKVKVLMKTWLKNKVLDIETRYDAEQRKDRDYVVSGTFRDETGDTPDVALVS